MVWLLQLLCAWAGLHRGFADVHTQVAVVLGGAQGAHQLRKWIKAAQWKQRQLVKEIQSQQTAQTKQRTSKGVAVDSVFFKRLRTILSM